MAAEPVAKLLSENADLKPLAERLERIQRLQRRFRTLAPEQLAQASRVCAIEGTTVVVCTASGPVAAALKQLAPRLLQGLRATRSRNSLKQNENAELTALRIEVQVAQPERRRTVVARPELPLGKLAALSGRLAESPLKATLERITTAARGKRK
jgi:hypothetical protein